MTSGSPPYDACVYADALLGALERGDAVGFEQGVETFIDSLPTLSPTDATAAAFDLIPVLEQVGWGFGSAVVRAYGVLCDCGVDPADVLPTLVDRAIAVLADVDLFKILSATLGVAQPESRNQDTFHATVMAMLEAAPDAGIDEGEVIAAVEAWFAGADWVQPVLYLAQRKDVRMALPRRDELTAAVSAAVADIDTAFWLNGLLLVLDDEPLLVLHRATGQGWRCTMSGIADNFQLHTMLAARLAGQIPETAPSPAEVAAAETGPELQPPGGIRGNFNLVDALGEWIWNEGRPADIPVYEGIRVAVIDPEPYPRSWNTGRLYPLMPPTLTIDAKLAGDEAAAWLAKVTPDKRGW